MSTMSSTVGVKRLKVHRTSSIVDGGIAESLEPSVDVNTVKTMVEGSRVLVADGYWVTVAR